jgi:hypothetical protein
MVACLRYRASLCVLLAAAAFTGAAQAQSGLKLPERGETGIDPTFARGWFAPEYDTFGFAAPHWRDISSLAAGNSRMRWSYAFGGRTSLGLSLARESLYSELEQRPLSVFGSYSFTQDWALSAESLSRDPLGLLRLQDFRIGLQRRF